MNVCILLKALFSILFRKATVYFQLVTKILTDITMVLGEEVTKNVVKV